MKNHKTIVHKGSETRICEILEINSKKFKLSHRIYNAGESFTVEVFDNTRLNLILDIYDIGFAPDGHLYIKREQERENRNLLISDSAVKLIRNIFTTTKIEKGSWC